MIKYIIFLVLIAFNANAKKVCKTGLQKSFGFKIYNITLCKNEDADYDTILNTKFSITLEYLVDVSNNFLVNSSIEEIKRNYSISLAEEKMYKEQLLQIFPSVNKGNKITLIFEPKLGCVLFYNQESIGNITDQSFAKKFVDIWLHPNSKFKDTRNFLFGK